jgi:transposase InsO family protein
MEPPGTPGDRSAGRATRLPGAARGVPGKRTDAREVVEAWRIEYNVYRPHSSLGGLTPVELERLDRRKPAPVLITSGSGSGVPSTPIDR